jgi:4a-hydroxytetrahydrobiopterin dehydratase
MAILSSSSLKSALTSIPDWKKRGKVLTRTLEFPDFKDAMRFVNAVARAAEKMNHHPDIDIRWNKVTLNLTTHDSGGLTEMDVRLASRIDQLAG